MAEAGGLGLEIIITDHHLPPPELSSLPDCPIINPSVANQNYPEKGLAGVGVAYKLACALIEKSNLDDAIKEKLKTRVLDLVAIGTVTDCMPSWAKIAIW